MRSMLELAEQTFKRLPLWFPRLQGKGSGGLEGKKVTLAWVSHAADTTLRQRLVGQNRPKTERVLLGLQDPLQSLANHSNLKPGRNKADSECTILKRFKA